MTSAPDLTPVIGLEVHAQVLTDSKMFCGCSASYAGAAPNSHVCAVCGGIPGALPVINRKAVESTIASALALRCTISPESRFDRKNYPYPDLPKGYQITQYDRPIGTAGLLEFEVDGTVERCRIRRVHLEEDTGKTIHTVEHDVQSSLVDYNRSGVPLMEIVSEPELASPASAREYFSSLRRILMYLGVNDGNLQEGSMRADVNVSLRGAAGAEGTKVEIKNLNSFRSVERALEYEIARQRALLREGGSVAQETRGWSERDEVTVPQRSKEFAHDYRYFPEPDLPPLGFAADYISRLKAFVPEMPAQRRSRLVRQYGLTHDVAEVLVAERPLADLFEKTAALAPGVPSGAVASWVTGELLRLVRETRTPLADIHQRAHPLSLLLGMIQSRAISGSAAKDVFEVVFVTGEDPNEVARRMDLMQISDSAELEAVVAQVLADNRRMVDDYRNGKARALDALVGRVMAATRGKADPSGVKEIMLSRLEGS